MLLIFFCCQLAVGECSKSIEVRAVRTNGVFTSKNAGVSNDRRWESFWPYDQGFQGEGRLPWVSQDLRRGRKA